MKNIINQYIRMTTDVGYDKVPADAYIDAKDIRVTTANGESNGSWTNRKGNVQSFTIPLLGTFFDPTQPNGLPVLNWTAVNPEIIDYCTIRNRIILFVADDSDTKGWIYDVQYDETTLDITPGSPNLVYYNGAFNFKKKFPSESIGRYESPGIQRVYWTDYNNNLRSVNLEGDLSQLQPGQIDVFPDVKYTQPLLKNIYGVGKLQSGTWLIAYRLKTLDGKQTLISPPSVPIHLVKDLETLPSQEYTGGPAEDTKKSILIEFKTSDYIGIFQELEVISLYYSSLTATPEILSVGSKDIIDNTLEFIITGFENTSFPIDITEYSIQVNPFSTVKTIIEKDGSLIVANIKSNTFDIDSLLNDDETFDARTIRYNSAGQNQNEYDGTAGTPAAKSITQLAFNEAYNIDAHWSPSYHADSQYKFKSDGVTLGGESVSNNNISYSFFLEPFTVDGNITEFPQIGPFPDFSYPHDLNDGSIPYSRTYPNSASPYLSGVLKGYKRGETYRFGIVFYNKKGESSFVKFIGDIKFPDISEADGAVNESGTVYWLTSTDEGVSGSTHYTQAYTLGVKFDLDFSSCPTLFNNIESYQIVRVKRENQDKRRVCSGFMRVTHDVGVGAPSADYDLRGLESSEDIFHLYPYKGNGTGPVGVQSRYHPFSFIGPTLQQPETNNYTNFGNYISFLSPELSYRFNSIGDLITSSDNTCLLLTGAYGAVSVSSTIRNSFTDATLAHNCVDTRMKARQTFPVKPSSVESIKRWGVGKVYNKVNYEIDHKTAVFGPFGTPPIYIRNYYAQPFCDTNGDYGVLNDPRGTTNYDLLYANAVIGVGGTSVLGNIEKLQNDPINNDGILGGGNFDYFNPSLIGPIDSARDDDSFPILDMVLPKNIIYGGFSEDVLENNRFIPCSPAISKNLTTDVKVLGGDIFLNMTPIQTSMIPLQTDFYDGEFNNYIEAKIETVSLVTESTINIDIDHGSTIKRGVTFTESYGITSQTLYRQEDGNTNEGIPTNARSTLMYDYNGAYSKESEDLVFFVKPFTQSLSSTNVNDIRAYLSDVKVNEEIIDSWTRFGLLNYYDVDDYGPINKIINLKDNVVFFQDKAVGNYSINPTQTIPSDTGGSVELGSGKGFSTHTYITTTSGSIHQRGIHVTDKGVFYFDALKKKINLLGEGIQPFSEIKGVHGFLQTLPPGVFLRKENDGDNTILFNGVAVGEDFINDEVTFLFHSKTSEGSVVSKSIVIDTITQNFISHQNKVPQLVINNRDITLTPDPNNPGNIYTELKGDWGKFYGNVEEAYITLVINPESNINKIIRNLEFNSIVRDDNKVIDRGETITAFRVQTETQDTGKIPFSVNTIKRRFNKWRIQVPRDINSVSQRGRLRNTYFILTLYYDNASNKEIIMNNLITYYDPQTF